MGSSWERNCGKLACLKTPKLSERLFMICSKEKRFDTSTCRCKRKMENKGHSNSSGAYMTKPAAINSFSATFATSQRVKRQRKVCRSSMTSLDRKSVV